MSAQRIGIGADAHAFEAGRKLVLGGVEIEHPRGLAGHSDADVLAHAIMDALLGAMREGDIGKLFPDTDEAYAGASSIGLLEEVGKLVRGHGYAIVDIDSVVVAQAPRLSPHRQAMQANIARALGIEAESVGVKATTTERLGFEGREEGISAWAVALLERQ